MQRPPRLTVGTLMEAVAVIALALGFVLWARRAPPSLSLEERARVAILHSAGRYMYKQPYPRDPASGLDGVGMDHARDETLALLPAMPPLRDICLNRSPISDAGLVHLRKVKGLERLRLSDTPVTDAGLAHLEGMTGLRQLELWRCAITDAGLAHLAKVPNLERLELLGTRVTDAGLMHLRGLSKLNLLNVEDTAVTDAGVERLQKALPRLRVLGRLN